MRTSISLTCSLILALAGGALACSDDGGDEQGDETTGDSASGDGDGDDSASGDGDGDDPATETETETDTGDGDGDDPTTDTGDGDGDDPTTGDGDGDDPTTDSGPPEELTFSGDIYPIIMANCSCHLGGAPAGLAMANVDGAYNSLVDVPSSSEPEFNRVTPGNADDSYLVRKVQGTAAVGGQMPLGGELTMMEQMMIADWVNQGAMP